MMAGVAVNLILGVATPLASGLFWSGVFRGRRPARLVSGWLSAAIGGGTFALFTHGVAYAAGCGVSALAAVAYWWWKRRRRDRAPRAYGAKSAALIAALVAKARESARPRPVLRPVPGGAR